MSITNTAAHRGTQARSTEWKGYIASYERTVPVHRQRGHRRARLLEHCLELIFIVQVQHDEVLLVMPVVVSCQQELVDHLSRFLFV